MYILLYCCRFNIRPRYFIIFVVVFSVLYNFPRFFEYRTEVETYTVPRPCIDLLDNNVDHLQVGPTD